MEHISSNFFTKSKNKFFGILDEMKKHYASDTKDFVIHKEDGDAIFFAFEKYTLGRHLRHEGLLPVARLDRPCSFAFCRIFFYKNRNRSRIQIFTRRENRIKIMRLRNTSEYRCRLAQLYSLVVISSFFL
jgi:hypothetical protein